MRNTSEFCRCKYPSIRLTTICISTPLKGFCMKCNKTMISEINQSLIEAYRWGVRTGKSVKLREIKEALEING